MMNQNYMRLVSSMNGGLVIPIFSNTKSISFDGVDESVTLPRLTDVESVGELSISGWIYYDTANGVYNGLFENQGANINSDWLLAGINPSDSPIFVLRNGGNGYGYAPPITVTGWYHIAYIYKGTGATDADVCKIYLNGVNQTLTFVGTPFATTTHSSSGVADRIGRGYTGYNDGDSTEISIFDYELSASQVTDIYNSGCPNDLGSLTPIHWYRADGSTYPTIEDVGSNPQDGTMINMEAPDLVTNSPC